MIHIRWLGLKVGATVSALDSGIGLAEIFVRLYREMFEKIMTPQTCLCQTLEITVDIRTDKGTCPVLNMLCMLGGHMIL